MMTRTDYVSMADVLVSIVGKFIYQLQRYDNFDKARFINYIVDKIKEL